MAKCPNCGLERKPEDTECLKCGTIYRKFEAAMTENRAAKKADAPRTLFQKYMMEVNLRVPSSIVI